MKIIEPSFEILEFPGNALEQIARAARNCYQSDSQKDESKFVQRLITSGHHSVLEHVSASVRLICDRGVMAEITRHRTGIAFSIESTRYCNYSKNKFGYDISVIRPFFFKSDIRAYNEWLNAMETCEEAYLKLIEDEGATPQEARSVLPNSLKTDIVVTANMRTWRHLFKLRCSPKAHPQMVQSMLPVLAEFYRRLPVVFEDIYEIHKEEWAE